MLSARFLRSPAFLSLLGLTLLTAVAIGRPASSLAATPSFGTATVTDNLFMADEVNTSLRHNIPNLQVFAGGQQRNADFKSHFESTGGLERWGLPISEVFEEEPGALTQYYQRGAVDFHIRQDLGGSWVLERRLTWDYMGGGLGGSVDMGVEPHVTNPHAGVLVGPWGHKISNVDITGKRTGFRDFFDRLGGVQSFGFPKTDAREDTGAAGMLLAQGATPGIVRQYFQAAVFEHFPDNPPQYRVQLTLLGDFLRNLAYPNNRWASLTPFLAAAELRTGGIMTLVAVDRGPPPTPSPAGTPTATPLPQFNPNNELIVVGSRRNGLSVYDGFVWKTINVENSTLGSNRINAVFVDDQRRIWVGTDSGLYRLNADLEVEASFTQSNSRLGSNDIATLSGDGSTTIWIGLKSRGAASYTATSTGDPWTWHRTDSSSIPSNSVRDLFMLDVGQNRVWFATGAGAAQYDGATDSWRRLTTTDGLASDDVTAVAIGGDGVLWFGTDGSGISSTPSGVEGSWTTYTTADGLGDDSIRKILTASTGTLWAATDGGLSRKSRTDFTFRTFNALNSGLLHNETRDLAEDSQGNIWIATGDGVSKFDTTANRWDDFRSTDGLAENDTMAIAIVPRR